MLEEHYHNADLFRWHLNVFLKALKEVPHLVAMALQNERGFSKWYKPVRARLNSDPLMAALSKNRDFVVHRGLLKPKSSGSVGITELRGMKLGISLPIDPLEDSSDAMDRYVHFASQKGDFLGFLQDDEDSVPCVERIWRIPDFDEELVDLCASAWTKTGQLLNEVVAWLGASEALPLSLSCRHSSSRVRFQLFNRAELQARLQELKRRAKQPKRKGPSKNEGQDGSRE